jgi:hypothetical protein
MKNYEDNATDDSRNDEMLDAYTIEIRRLQALRGYPKDETELLRIARKYARSIPHLRKAVSNLLENQERCPAPAIVRESLDHIVTSEPKPKCPFCDGSGYRVVFKLVTKNRDPETGKLSKTVESLTEPQYKQLCEVLPEWGEQQAVEAAEKCQCRL